MVRVARTFQGVRGPIPVLQDVSFAIQPGDFIALTGPSGSGKSTLLNLASLLDRPSAGAVLFEGRNLSAADEARLGMTRKLRIGMVFQSFHLLSHRSALENVLFRFRYLDMPRTDAARLARSALADLGLEPIADQPARLLSGGEMQRVAIARAVAQRPSLLLADEPTGNLDPESAHVVMQTFQRLNRDGITILLATHNASLLPFCSRHLECRNGAVAEAPAP